MANEKYNTVSAVLEGIGKTAPHALRVQMIECALIGAYSAGVIDHSQANHLARRYGLGFYLKWGSAPLADYPTDIEYPAFLPESDRAAYSAAKAWVDPKLNIQIQAIKAVRNCYGPNDYLGTLV